MRGLLVFAVLVAGLAAAAPNAWGGPIYVEIQPETEVREPFVVSVTGHYANIHNGTSRPWKQVAFRAGEGGFIPLGPVNVLLNMGVSVSIYHPAYVSERTRSMRTPLLVRPVSFDVFHPLAWQRVVRDGTPIEHGGLATPLGLIHSHLGGFRMTYLPVVDEATGDLAVSEVSLRAQLPLLEELVRFAMTDAAAQPINYFAPRDPPDPAYDRRIVERDRKLRAELRDELFRIREWLAVPRAERVALRRLMQHMRYGQDVSERLMTEFDREEIASFLARYAEDEAAKREPDTTARWVNPVSRVEYRVRLGRPGRCFQLGITADLTNVVSADVGGLTNRVKAKYCSKESGGWEFTKP